MTENLHLLLPEFLLAALAVAVLMVDAFLSERWKGLLPWLSVAGLGGLLALALWLLWGEDQSLYGGLVEADAYSLFFKVMFMALGVVVCLGSADYVKKHFRGQGEFYSIVIIAVLGMMVMASAAELLTAYIALELMTFCFYILVAFARHDRKSNEAGVKYILIGAFSSAILLYGVSLLYGAVGTTRYGEIETAIAGAMRDAGSVTPTLWVGLALILVGLGFKVAAAPFHMWAPDTYEGAPLPVTAFLSVGSKVAAFALILRLFAEAFAPSIDQWRPIVAGLAAATMTIGNLVAIAQTNYKRLLAYSSIGHVGFMLTGIAALSLIGTQGLILYMVGYAVTSMAVFVALIAFFNMTGREDIYDLGGLADSHPFIAASIAIGLFSLAGLPFFAGFTMKFYLFTAVGDEGLLWLAGLAIFNSLISLYYYLMVVRQMYIEPPPAWAASEAAVAVEGGRRGGRGARATAVEERRGSRAGQAVAVVKPIRPGGLITGVLALLTLGTIFIGVYPFQLVEAVKAASRALFAGG
ncbi:MAG: NADH-quinone oxidoreductase subunit N [SAR202 cluster bacterium]|nr:NADH-quinone oxidoreductase subunit N [SAR202 cluster bacterium]